ncbi:hypothetical protein SLEP1_g6822 [Rubroshorea leprosula]|uniref:Uncharacterized protein n=1 Tax=Rubroshorea leprosula TaxID=152421 RepID=A0AAV5HWS9_9ROSI|nr:hypothetical protein SLEP1_g6822 [Rubroshorea leprosula]
MMHSCCELETMACGLRSWQNGRERFGVVRSVMKGGEEQRNDLAALLTLSFLTSIPDLMVCINLQPLNFLTSIPDLVVFINLQLDVGMWLEEINLGSYR